MSRVLLIVRDGWGYSTTQKGNAILNAKKPFDDFLLSETPSVLLGCHGPDVGLPDGFQGSSEVGHLNMGAGRIVTQEVTRIFSAIQDGSLFRTEKFSLIEKQLSRGDAALHLFGLLQNEGVHAHQEHLFQLIRKFKSLFPGLRIWVHPIADGRDTPPRSFKTFYKQLTEVMEQYSDVGVATVWGRYYGMDRSKNWDLVDVAYEAMLFGKGERTRDVIESVARQYDTGKTPDGVPMFDEYLEPMISEDYSGMKPGDVIINFNYRQDRAIQISRAFVDPECSIRKPLASELFYFGLTRYYDEFTAFLIPPMSQAGGMKNILGEVLAANNIRQLRISETQKFRHVTSFFNGKRTEPYPGEEQVEIPGEFDPSTFASHPEMNAGDVTRELLQRLESNYAFILVNYANCDMVGHTGDYAAARKAAGIVDENVAAVAEKAMERNYHVLITADHGNSEEMLDAQGEPKTSHTINPVKLHVLSRIKEFSFHSDTGILSDIAPLVLKLMGLDIPAEMTSRHLSDAATWMI